MAELRAQAAALQQRLNELAQEEDIWKKCRQLEKSLSARSGELMMANQELRRQDSVNRELQAAYEHATGMLNRIFSTSHAFIAFLDIDFNFIRVNEGYAAANGHQPDFFVGKNLFDFYPREYYEEIFCHVVQTGQPHSSRATPLVHLRDPERGQRYWDLNLLPVKGSGGEVEGLLFSAVDVTERVQAEEAQRKTEALFRRLFDQAPSGAAIVGLDYRYQRVNEEYCRITGYSAEEMVSKTFVDITHPDDIENDVRYARALVSGEIDHYQMEKRYIRKGGEVIWVALWARVIRDQEGKPLCFLPLVQDITQRKQAEEALRASEERYRLHFENLSDVVYITDLDMRVSDISPSVKALTGYSPEEIIGRRIDELNLLAPEYRETGLRNTMRVLEGNRSGPTEYEFITKDGSRKFGEISGSPLLKSGRVIAVISVARDITARKRIEEELDRYRLHLEEMVEQRTEELIGLNRQLEQEITERRKAEEQLQTQAEFSERLIDSSADGIVAFDKNTCFTEWNHAMERATGLLKKDVIGRNAMELFPYLKETGEAQNYAAVLEGKTVVSKDRPYYIEETARRGFYEAHYSPLRNRAGEIIGGLAIVRDISERRHFEEVLRESEAKYRHLSESLEVMVKKQVAELKQAESLAAIGKMISIVAHELRNPLQNVQLGVENLRHVCLEPEQQDILNDLEIGLNMLGGVMEELLDFSRPTRLNRSAARIEAIVDHAIEIIRPLLQNISLRLEVCEEEMNILLDSEKMSRVLINLIKNSVEAMPHGGEVHVCADLHGGKAGSSLRISVSDTGCGIAEDILFQIEHPFFTTKPRGTGLGLSICRKIIEAHGGSMRITSTPGAGTRVEVVVPAEIHPDTESNACF
ncbi:MAG: PAS domain S-box protein [Candidatus Abyssobacteria bacterium SURF_5]|uniref:histidine kinase n=1 Tax=Abyssobacteria bacterium (strain SURF_5) TaxID=2093360 RepID=A0A3A4NUC7_ABYX5|nr:MAG: PAS domain S-box protein [Candidatus Abyssubacteria bacterium SURF_5]